ncbi:MAG TPA: hypothetical protein VF803_03270 [Candidatus Paceibacterota bacterium]
MPKGITIAQVIATISGPGCGIHGEIDLQKPLKQVFSVTAASLWISLVSVAFVDVPDDVLSAAPDDTIATVADRIVAYYAS